MSDTRIPIFKHNVPTTDTVMLQHGALAMNFVIEPFRHGLIPTLTMLGYKLWYGYLQPHVFLHQITRFSKDTNDQVVKALLAKQDPGFENLSTQEKESIKSLLIDKEKETAFARYMTNLALVENWKIPALINRAMTGHLYQSSGAMRAFATLMTKTDPWTQFPVLVLDHNANDINSLLENPIHCHNDETLHDIFGKKMTAESWDPELVIDIHVGYNYNIGAINCRLNQIHDGHYYDPHQWRGLDLLESHVNWRKKAGPCPKLYIHTNHPENIKNHQHWDVKFVPLELDQEFLDICVDRPAWFEKVVQSYRENPVHESDSYVLWVLDDRRIDLGDLAWWGDDHHNVMIDADWKFILYQHSESYIVKSIKVSQAK